jgi:hypothetical protein
VKRLTARLDTAEGCVHQSARTIIRLTADRDNYRAGIAQLTDCQQGAEGGDDPPCNVCLVCVRKDSGMLFSALDTLLGAIDRAGWRPPEGTMDSSTVDDAQFTVDKLARRIEDADLARLAPQESPVVLPRTYAVCAIVGNRYEPLPEAEQQAASGPFPVMAARMMGLFACVLCPKCNEWCPDKVLYPGEFACDTPPCPTYPAPQEATDVT